MTNQLQEKLSPRLVSATPKRANAPPLPTRPASSSPTYSAHDTPAHQSQELVPLLSHVDREDDYAMPLLLQADRPSLRTSSSPLLDSLAKRIPAQILVSRENRERKDETNFDEGVRYVCRHSHSLLHHILQILITQIRSMIRQTSIQQTLINDRIR